MTADVLGQSATELVRMLREREISAAELVDLHAARIEERNPEINAIVLPRIEEARAEAVAADRGEARGPLHGLPFTAKDGIAVAGMPWPNGSKLLTDVVCTYDAPSVARLRRAGAILLGKTNVPEFCAFYDSVNDVFGATRNPHDVARSAGGSSGGEAAAVASGMSALGLGSDLTSSIRNPAHFTGLFGLKPSSGLVPCAGHAPDGETPIWSRIAAIGPLTRGADDLTLALDVLAEHPARPPRAAGVVGVSEDDLVQPVAADCRRAVRLAADALADAGYEVVEDRPPCEAELREHVDRVIVSELAGALASLVAGREDQLSDFGRMIVAGAARMTVTFDDYLDAWRRLGQLRAEIDGWFERRQLVLCPVAPGPAPLSGTGFTEIDGEPVRPGGKMGLCVLASAGDLPAASVPALKTAAGLPIGVQVIGGRGRDREVIEAAKVLERALGGWIRPSDV